MSSKQKIKLSVLEGIVREIVKTLAKEMSGTAAASPVTGPNAFVKKKFTEKVEPDDTELAVDTTRKSNCCGAPPDREVAKDNSGRCSKCKDGAMFSGGKKVNEMTTTGAVSGFQVPGWVSRKGGSQKGIEGSAALGYELTPMGKKEMQRTGDKLVENKQAALGKKFGKAQKSYDAQSEPEPEQCHDCKESGHDWTVKAYRDPKSGKLTTWKKCDCCGVTTNPSTK
jgi:hypothetical protein